MHTWPNGWSLHLPGRRRDGEGEDEGMEDWDQEMLEKAIAREG